VYHKLAQPILGRYVRIRPTGWHGHISIRVQLHGSRGRLPFYRVFELKTRQKRYMIGRGKQKACIYRLLTIAQFFCLKKADDRL